jgi:flagellar biosynthesis/type III secretory pathway protein FliH
MRFNQTKFAELIGCSQQNVNKLLKKGTIQKEDDNKIDKDKAIQSLRDFGLLDENNKLIKSRTPKKEKDLSPTVIALPFDGPIEYDSLDGKSEEEKEEILKEKERLHQEYSQKKVEAAQKGITEGKDSGNATTYSDAKAHREHYMGKIAEFDYLIKLGDYVRKEDVETTFFEAARNVRDNLLSFPNKMAIRIIGKTDIQEIENILMEEIQNILRNLSR